MFGLDHIRKELEYLQLRFAWCSVLNLERSNLNVEFHIQSNSAVSSGACWAKYFGKKIKVFTAAKFILFLYFIKFVDISIYLISLSRQVELKS